MSINNFVFPAFLGVWMTSFSLSAAANYVLFLHVEFVINAFTNHALYYEVMGRKSFAVYNQQTERPRHLFELTSGLITDWFRNLYFVLVINKVVSVSENDCKERIASESAGFVLYGEPERSLCGKDV